jgi:hypothetical protein
VNSRIDLNDVAHGAVPSYDSHRPCDTINVE